jgi:hypothetical protein
MGVFLRPYSHGNIARSVKNRHDLLAGLESVRHLIHHVLRCCRRWGKNHDESGAFLKRRFNSIVPPLPRAYIELIDPDRGLALSEALREAEHELLIFARITDHQRGGVRCHSTATSFRIN